MDRGKVIDDVEEGVKWMALYCKCDGCGRGGASEAVLFDGSTSVRYPCTSTRTRSIVAKGS